MRQAFQNCFYFFETKGVDAGENYDSRAMFVRRKERKTQFQWKMYRFVLIIL
jgi:hypothetical protein